MFAYYTKWISNYSSKIRPLVENKQFLMPPVVVNSFEGHKKDIAESSVKVIDDELPFVIETDASEKAIRGILLQAGRPVAFFSQSLNLSEMRLHIVECVHKWRNLITIITDQQAVSFMFKPANCGKIKNNKIIRWKMELLPFSYDIKHHPGNENVFADTLSQTCVAASSMEELKSIHNSLIHPGVQRIWHFVRSQNMPYSINEVRCVIPECTTCAKIKP